MEMLVDKHLYDFELWERELKTMNSDELRERFFLDVQSWTTFEDRAQMSAAFELAAFLHADDQYGNDEYTRHTFRVATRLEHYYGVRDVNVLTAAPLHDSVEDHPKLMELLLPSDLRRENTNASALHFIEQTFNADVAYLVAGMTNPWFGDNLSLEEFHAAYQQSVSDKIQGDPRKAVIKVADIDDNALGLHHAPSLAFQKRQVPKYAPILPVIRQELLTGMLPSVMSSAAVPHLLAKIDAAEVRFAGILSR